MSELLERLLQHCEPPRLFEPELAVDLCRKIVGPHHPRVVVAFLAHAFECARKEDGSNAPSLVGIGHSEGSEV